MTNPTPLSPAAQAVLNAVLPVYDDEYLYVAPMEKHAGMIAAAALRAAADQVVPPDPCGDDCCITQCEEIRAAILAIATELNGTNPSEN